MSRESLPRRTDVTTATARPGIASRPVGENPACAVKQVLRLLGIAPAERLRPRTSDSPRCPNHVGGGLPACQCPPQCCARPGLPPGRTPGPRHGSYLPMAIRIHDFLLGRNWFGLGKSKRRSATFGKRTRLGTSLVEPLEARYFLSTSPLPIPLNIPAEIAGRGVRAEVHVRRSPRTTARIPARIRPAPHKAENRGPSAASSVRRSAAEFRRAKRWPKFSTWCPRPSTVLPTSSTA